MNHFILPAVKILNDKMFNIPVPEKKKILK